MSQNDIDREATRKELRRSSPSTATSKRPTEQLGARQRRVPTHPPSPPPQPPPIETTESRLNRARDIILRQSGRIRALTLISILLGVGSVVGIGNMISGFILPSTVTTTRTLTSLAPTTTTMFSIVTSRTTLVESTTTKFTTETSTFYSVSTTTSSYPYTVTTSTYTGGTSTTTTTSTMTLDTSTTTISLYETTTTHTSSTTTTRTTTSTLKTAYGYFEGFSGTTLSPLWSYSGTILLSNGNCTITSGYIRSKQPAVGLYPSLSLKCNLTFSNVAGQQQWWGFKSGDNYAVSFRFDGTNLFTSTRSPSGTEEYRVDPYISGMRNYEIRYYAGINPTADFFINNVKVSRHTQYVPTGPITMNFEATGLAVLKVYFIYLESI